MSERYSQEEKDYYQSVVEKAAEKGHPHIDDDSRLEQLVEEIGASHDVHDDLKARFKRDVHRRIQEMWNAAESEQERRVIKEYEGYVQVVDGKYQPAGIDEAFKFTVRPGIRWSWRDIGNIWDGIFGKKIDGDEFHAIIDATEKAREALEDSRRELELLGAARKSTKELLSLGASGFMSRLRQRKGGIFASAAGGVKDIFAGREANKEAALEMKRTQKLIEEKTKQLEKEEKFRDVVLQKVDMLRDDSRKLFSKTFQKQIDTLLDQQDEISPHKFEEEKEKLRKKVDQWSERTGFMHMNIFFREEFGEEPGMEEPITDLESKKRNVLVSRFYKNIIGQQPSPGVTQEVTQLLKRRSPQVLQLIHEDKYPQQAMDTLQFLFKGKFKNITLSPKSRIMEADAEDISDYVSLALEYINEAGNDLPRILQEFAENWKGVNAREFDDVFDLILTGQSPAIQEGTAMNIDQQKLEQLTLVSNHWKDVTGENISDDDAEKILQLLQNHPSFSKRIKRLLQNGKRKGFMKIAFQGYSNDVNRPWIANDQRFAPVGIQEYLTVLQNVDDIVNNITEDEERWREVILAFLESPSLKGHSLEMLDASLFQQILNVLKSDKTQPVVSDEDTPSHTDPPLVLDEKFKKEAERERKKRKKLQKKLKKAQKRKKTPKSGGAPAGSKGGEAHSNAEPFNGKSPSHITLNNTMNVQINNQGKTYGVSYSEDSPVSSSPSQQPYPAEPSSSVSHQSYSGDSEKLSSRKEKQLVGSMETSLSQGEKRLLFTFLLHDDPKTAQSIYHNLVEEHPEWGRMFNSKKNRQMLQFFMRGKLKQMSLIPPNVTGKAKEEYILDVLELLPFFNKSSIRGLEQDYKDFSRTNKKGTCQQFLSFLRKTYIDFL